MALVLDDTVAGSSANTYIDLADAQTYFDARLNITEWTAATTDNQNRALAMATSMLDDLYTWVGTKLTEDQALKWPRSNAFDIDGYSVATDSIHPAIREATCEQALTLLKDDVTAIPAVLKTGFRSAKVGPLEYSDASWSMVAPSTGSRVTQLIVGSGLGSMKSTNGRTMRA